MLGLPRVADPSDLYEKWGLEPPSSSPSSSAPSVPAMPGMPTESDDAATPVVFWGYRNQPVPFPYDPRTSDAPASTIAGKIFSDAMTIHAPQEKTLESAVAWFSQLPYSNPKKYRQFRALMERAGLVTLKAGLESATEAFQQFAYNIGQSYAATGKERTPEEWLIRLAGAKGGGPDGTGDGSLGFTGTKTQVDTSVDLLGESQSKNYAEQAFVAAIGREPNKKELARFRAAMDTAAQSDPTVTEQTATYEDGAITGVDTTTSGGVDYAQVAMDQADAKEGAAEYQAVGYMDALYSALGTPGGV